MTLETTRAQHGRLFKAIAAAALALMILVLAYVGIRDHAATRNVPAEKLSIALPTLPYFALVHVAAAQGYLAEEGLDVSILPVSHGVAAIDNVLQGTANLAVATEVPFVISVMKGNALAIIATVGNATNDNSIIARRDRAIADARDLAGKKVGVTFGAGSSYFLWTFLIGHKLAPDSIQMVNVPPNRIVEALTNGSVDAVATWQPISLEAQAALGDNAVSLANAGINGTTSVMAGRSEFLKGNAKTIENVARALLKAEQFMRLHPEQTLSLVAKWLRTDVDALRPTWKDFNFRVSLLQTQLTSMEGQSRWAMARGYVETRPVPNFLSNLYLDALLAVAPERVTVIR